MMNDFEELVEILSDEPKTKEQEISQFILEAAREIGARLARRADSELLEILNNQND